MFPLETQKFVLMWNKNVRVLKLSGFFFLCKESPQGNTVRKIHSEEIDKIQLTWQNH